MHANSITQKVLEFVRANPGATRAQMLAVLPDGVKRRSVTSALLHLAKGEAVTNRGGSGLSARWYPIIIEVDFKFRRIARELLAELKDVHHSQREEYLALKLQELFGEA
jgi:hypothetical protein